VSEPVISLHHIELDFGGRRVLEKVSLEVQAGEFIAIIGPSGGGKSTLLRVVAGLLRAKGEVRVPQHTAMVFQDYRLLPWRTVRQNVALPRELTGRGMSADEALKQVGMQPFSKLYPHQLSGGMRARVAIARALAQDAEVLLFDEPFAALDALVRERFNLEIKKIHEKTKKTSLFVTHSIREAVYLADRVVVLRDGRIERILETRGEGRLTAFTDGLEAELRELLGVADSTHVEEPPTPLRFPWELLGVFGILLALLLAWNLAVPEPTLFTPTPGLVWQSLLKNTNALLIPGALETLRIAGLGLLWSLGIGIPLGYFMGKSRILERLISPFIVGLQAVPVIVIAPILVVLPAFGYGSSSRVLIAALISVFPVLIATMIGVREVDRVYREVFQTIGSSVWGVLRKLEIPGALPVILGGLRNTISLALIGTIVAEFTLGTDGNRPGGLGYVIQNIARRDFDIALGFASVFVLVVIGTTLYLLVTLLELWVLRYRRR
jgi:NitT/TauT family transport system ATP-binding protein